MSIVLNGTGGTISGVPGQVLQVVPVTTTTSTTTTTNSYADVGGMTATITPSSTSSKILVLMNCNYELYRAAIEATASWQVLRNSTAVYTLPQNSTGLEAGLSTGSRVYLDGVLAIMFVDSPATTSATTYKLQFLTTSTGSSVHVSVNNQGNNSQTATVTLMEIAA